MYFLPEVLLAILIIQLLSLYLFSSLLINSLARLLYSVAHTRENTVTLLALLLLPGTIIHELAHALVAGVMLVQVGNIEFMPQIREDGTVKLGSAEIYQTDIFRRAIIGIAPVLVGATLIIGSLILFANQINNSHVFSIPISLALFYILFEISNTMFSSKKDMEGVVEVGVIILGLFVGAYLFHFYLPFQLLQKLLLNNTNLLQQINLLLLIPILIDLSIYVLTKALSPKHY